MELFIPEGELEKMTRLFLRGWAKRLSLVRRMTFPGDAIYFLPEDQKVGPVGITYRREIRFFPMHAYSGVLDDTAPYLDQLERAESIMKQGFIGRGDLPNALVCKETPVTIVPWGYAHQSKTQQGDRYLVRMGIFEAPKVSGTFHSELKSIQIPVTHASPEDLTLLVLIHPSLSQEEALHRSEWYTRGFPACEFVQPPTGQRDMIGRT